MRTSPTSRPASGGTSYPIYHLVDGDLHGAADAFDRAMAVPAHHPGRAFPSAGLWALVRTILDDDGDAARDEVHSLPVDTPVSRAMSTGRRCRRPGRGGDADAATARFAAADAALDRFEGGFRRALVRLLVAPGAARGRVGRAAHWLRESLAVLRARRAHALVARSRAGLRDIGAPVPRRGRGDGAVCRPRLAALGITSREADVLALVAAGCSNREAAERLVISPRTVDKHVERLLMKAGTNRDGLAHLARDAGVLST